MTKCWKPLLRIVCLALVFSLVLPLGLPGGAQAANPPQPAPEKLEVKAIHNTPPGDVQPPVGYNEFDRYYADLQWAPLKQPVPAIAEQQYLNFYLQEVTKPYKPSRPIVLKERDVPGSTTALRMKNLNSGTIYYVYTKAYYTYTQNTTTYTSAESDQSNTVKILTDIDIDAYSYGTNQIRIEWDDVWNSGRRIDYKLFVSEDSSFANTSPIHINQSQIGNGVKVNEANGKLEYIHTVRDPGRVYYVKIVPDIVDPELKRSAETETIAVSSHILVKTTKMSETEEGTIWRFEWSPVVIGLSSGDIKITYQIDKLVNNVPIPMLLESGTSTFITVPKGQEDTFYIIRANVTRGGQPLYPGVKIESDKIMVKDQEVAASPGTPELVDRMNDSYGQSVIEYAKLLKPNSATLLWRAPKKADGTVDFDIAYDIWLIGDPNTIDNPAPNTRIASSFKPGESNRVLDGTQLVGYKYDLTNLTPNATYYFKIVAKKAYLEYVDGVLKKVDYASLPALKVVITPAGGPIEQPLVPARPPLQIKKINNEYAIKETEVTLELKNRWFESYNTTGAAWEYIRTEKLNESNTPPPPYDPINNLPDGLARRMVEYDSGVTFDVGCVKFVEGMSMADLNNLPANKVMGYPVQANDEEEDPTWNVPENYVALNADPAVQPVYAKHNVNIKLTGLEPNTTYIIWVRASRASANASSGPSDPIIVTTDPVVTTPVEKPTVPVINYTFEGDTYVDLGWNIKPGYNYSIRYGLLDNPSSGTKTLKVTAQELAASGLSYYRVKDLVPDTTYYFWIQAEAVSGSQTSQSDWSDSYPVKTLPYAPPATPRGFGVKTETGSVTKNSILFEWIREEGLEYILEVAGDVDYRDVKEYKAGNAGEFKVEGLRSNYRYYARLYAFDPKKKLKSQPTQSITVRTARSSDDYDSDQDIENVISGDYVIKDPTVVKGVWTIRITGVNADRFIERMYKDTILDYRLDATKPPSQAQTISIFISSRVFDGLSRLKENLVIATTAGEFTVRPGVLSAELVQDAAGKLKDFNYEFRVTFKGAAPADPKRNINFKTPITGITVNAFDGSNALSVSAFSKPLKVTVPYSGSSWYKDGRTAGYIQAMETTLWKKAVPTASFNADEGKGILSFDMAQPGDWGIGEPGSSYFDDILGHEYEDAINRVMAAVSLKSVTSRTFRPDSSIAMADAVRIMLDVINYKYDQDVMAIAVKAGIIPAGDLNSATTACSREKALAMVVRLYEIMSGETASPSTGDAYYPDSNGISPGLSSKVMFAAENGITLPAWENKLEPRRAVTRAELLGLLEKLLALTGEIE